MNTRENVYLKMAAVIALMAPAVAGASDPDFVVHPETGRVVIRRLDEDAEILNTAYQDQRARVATGVTGLMLSTRRRNQPSAGNLLSVRVGTSLLSERSRRRNPGSDLISGLESRVRATTDAANLLGKSMRARNIVTQQRNPVINDPRVRGMRTGQLTASGSYWVPARIDLDSMLSKIDSRIIQDVVVIKGPYSALHGPGLSFMDIQLKPSPRTESGNAAGGMSSLEYKTNGEQWYGRQELWSAGVDSGVAVSYGHRTGNDYTVGGSDEEIPASFNSRDVNVALGFDLDERRSLEFNYIRLDQTGVELPGQVFDIDTLETDGFDLTYEVRDGDWYDSAFFETWYNQTNFQGIANPQKADRFTPLFIRSGFSPDSRTLVNSQSLGYRTALNWESKLASLTMGTDLRFIRQHLDEFTSFMAIQTGNVVGPNSPVLKANQINPGLFVEASTDSDSGTVWTAGARVDLVQYDVLDSPELSFANNNLSARRTLSGANAILTDTGLVEDMDPLHVLWSTYLTGITDHGNGVTTFASAGFGQRPPTLTEMYAVEPFLFLVQSGFSALRGNPRLDPSRGFQVDIGAEIVRPDYRASVTGFYSVIEDFITFDSELIYLREQPLNVPVVLTNGTSGDLIRANGFQNVLRTVNSDLAAIGGFELDGDAKVNEWVTAFGSLAWTHGTDLRRNAENRDVTTTLAPFSDLDVSSTIPNGQATTIDSKHPQILSPDPVPFALGQDDIVEIAQKHEPLPSINPLEARLGFRLHEPVENPRYSVEFAARIVTAQDRVASSLFETATPGFTLFDVRSYWKVTDKLLLIAGVENLTDKQYREHLDFRDFLEGLEVRRPGRSWYSAVELRY